MEFTELVDLASEQLGGNVLYANDDFFAEKENLIRRSSPVFIPDKYTDRGKWMDGWESRRRRSPRMDEKYDECIIRLGTPGAVHGLVVDTSHFKGNYPSHCSAAVCTVKGLPTVQQLLDPATRWDEILPLTALEGDTKNSFPVKDPPGGSTHLRLKIFPDGGVARLRVHGVVQPDWDALRKRDSEIDLAAVENGGVVLDSSDMFFGHRHNLIMPGRALDMSDGWETKRNREPGHKDWSIVKLGTAGTITRVEIDTLRFKGNYPESCSIEAGDINSAKDLDSMNWAELLKNKPLQAHTLHVFADELENVGPVTHARFNIYPDGGISRLRLFGKPS
ncbi:MAG TPA: allantoicase [Pyrinomonadaceae bacterium]|jgi:allantoicase|nr:allantoicase [Pyrinomonadaceae bacterium]